MLCCVTVLRVNRTKVTSRNAFILYLSILRGKKESKHDEKNLLLELPVEN